MSQFEDSNKKGRPRKKGLDYFSMDTKPDIKIEALEAEHGNDGFAVFFKCLQEIYQTEDGELDISNTVLRRILAKRANVSESKWMQILESAVEVQLFDKHKFSAGILTSNGVKKRFGLVQNTREAAKKRAERRRPNNNNLAICSPEKVSLFGEQCNKQNKTKLNKKENAGASETPIGARAPLQRPERRIFSRSNSDTNPLTNALLKKAGIS